MGIVHAKKFKKDDYKLPFGYGRTMIDTEKELYNYLVRCLLVENFIPNGADIDAGEIVIEGIPVDCISLERVTSISGGKIFNFKSGEDDFKVKITLSKGKKDLSIETTSLPTNTVPTLDAGKMCKDIYEKKIYNVEK